jgi:HPt (histidine-containing phosphotransfer) domain-containing protein
MSAPNPSQPAVTSSDPVTLANLGHIDRWVGAFVAALAAVLVYHGLTLEEGFDLNLYIAIGIVLGPGLLLWSRARAEHNRREKALADLAEGHRKITAQSAQLVTAKAETDRIMETVQEGLFLVDEKGDIGEQHSRALYEIFRLKEVSGENLFDILKRLLSEKMFNTTKDYFALLFDVTKKEKTVLKVNPLGEIEVNFVNPEGGFLNRHLGFSFRRIVENGKVVRVFVAVRDITKQVELEKKLRDAEKHKERQLDILLGIVHIPSDELGNFTKLIETELENINQTLRAEDFARMGSLGTEELRKRLKTVFRAAHNIKGNAALLKLSYFQKAAHDFETKIAELLDRPRLVGDDFLPIVICEAALRDDLLDLHDLKDKISGMRSLTPGGPATATVSSPAAAFVAKLQELVEGAARDLGKASTLSVDEFAVHTVAFGRFDLMRDVLIQLTRNSLAHSIESPGDRAAAGKPPVANLQVRGLPTTSEGLVGLAFRDDGRGLNLERIRERGLAAGLLDAERAAAATPDDLAALIFAPGFSTAEQVGDHAGRGMGMDIIKSKVVDEAGGVLEVHSTPGQFCEFRVYLPPVAKSAQA